MVINDVREMIEYAIKLEENAYNLYMSAGKRVKDPGARAYLTELAGEEKKHKEKLGDMLAGDLEWMMSTSRNARVKDLKISAVLEAKPITESSDFQGVLTFAIKQEEQAEVLYSQMASLADPGPVRRVFEALAREEAGHKEYLEGIFDQDIYKDF
jgi:rubrerythrin